jgi:hypothetical protein
VRNTSGKLIKPFTRDKKHRMSFWRYGHHVQWHIHGLLVQAKSHLHTLEKVMSTSSTKPAQYIMAMSLAYTR